jgi:hypothetical protein
MGRVFAQRTEENCRGLKRDGRDRQWNCRNTGVPKCNLGTRELDGFLVPKPLVQVCTKHE